jgi:DNA polymerase-1
MYLAIDCETSYTKGISQYPWVPGAFLSTVAIYTSEGDFEIWTFRHNEASLDKTEKQKALEIQSWVDKANKIIGHNLQFDYNWLKSIGVSLEDKPLWDTMIVEYLLSAQRNTMPSLDSLAERELGEKKIDVVKKEYWEQGINTDQVPLSILSEYNTKDCELTLRLAEKQVPQVIEKKLTKLVKLKGEEIKCVAEIEFHGLGISETIRQQLEYEFGGKLRSIVERVQEIAGKKLNIDSPAQVSALLYGGSYSVGARMWYTVELKNGTRRLRSRRDVYTKTIRGLGFKPLANTEGKEPGQYSTDKNTLVALLKFAPSPEAKEVVELLLERSSIATLLKTFIVGIKDKVIDGVVHTDVNQTITATGRFSSTNPNLMNIPREGTAPVKRQFIPQLDYFVEGDAKSLEWNVGAFLSQCPVMMKEILDGIDPHAATGRDIFNGAGIRTDWKIYNFRYLYGGSPYAFFMDPKMPAFSQRKWEQIHRRTKEKYFGHSAWVTKNVQAVYRNSGVLTNPTGRLFKFDTIEGRAGKEYRLPQIANYPVQSLATADIIPLAMYHIHRRLRHLRPNAFMCNEVHDSIMYDTRKEHINEIADTMLGVFESLPKLIEDWFGFSFNVPMSGEIKFGTNWGEMEKY